MKDSGVEWIGEIPAQWNLSRIQNCLQEIKEKNFPVRTSQVLSLVKDKGVMLYEDKGNIGNKSKDDITEYKIAYPNTLIVNSMNILIGSVGISNYFGCVSPVYYVFKETDKSDLRFINYIFNTNGLQKELRKYANGILEIRLRVSANDIFKQKIPLPSKAEQTQLADFLDAKCAEIDALSADIQAQIDTLEQYKRSVITEAVTKGLNPDAEMRDSGIPWIKEIPAHWKVMPNKYLMHKHKTLCPLYRGEDILSLTMNGVIVRDLDAGGKMPTTFDGYQQVESGNLLMCLFDIDVTPRCVGIARQDGVTSPAYSRFVLEPIADASYYCYYYTMLDNDKTLLHLAKNLRHSFTEDQLGAIFTVVPPLSEQRNIASFLNKKCTMVDNLIGDKKHQLEMLADYKKSLIFEYVTGKKEVPAS